MFIVFFAKLDLGFLLCVVIFYVRFGQFPLFKEGFLEVVGLFFLAFLVFLISGFSKFVLVVLLISFICKIFILWLVIDDVCNAVYAYDSK